MSHYKGFYEPTSTIEGEKGFELFGTLLISSKHAILEQHESAKKYQSIVGDEIDQLVHEGAAWFTKLFAVTQTNTGKVL